MEYLGHIIKADGVATNSIKIEAMIKWSTPSNITELTSFLGLTGYYKRFIKKNYRIICKPVFTSLKYKVSLWTEEQHMAFTALKEKMTKAHVLALPNFSKPFVLKAYTNAYGIGEVLMQGGIPIAYHSENN